MADYYPLLSRAVRALPQNTPEARAVIYARAQEALRRHLLAVIPPISEEALAQEHTAFEAATDRLEADYAPELTPSITGLTRDHPQPPLPEHTSGEAEPEQIDALPFRVPSPMEAMQPIDGKPFAPDDAVKPSEDAQIITPQIIRPQAPMSREKGASRTLRIMVAMGGFITLCGMGALALSNREPVARYRPALNTVTSENATEITKREGRLSGAEATQSPDAGGRFEKQASATVPDPALGEAQQPSLMVASRAFMVIEGETATPRQFEGQAVWRFSADTTAKDAVKSLRTQIGFDAAGISVELTLSRNMDSAISASHTLLSVFETKGNIPPVREMSMIEWRERENQAGVAFAGVVVPVQDNVFMLGLDKSDYAIARNIELLRGLKWMVFEIRLANGRRGAMLVEKGTSGERAIAEALAAWK